MTRTQRTSKESHELAELRTKIVHLEAELRQSLIHRIIDLEVAAGARHEKTREQRAVEMADPTRLPLNALEEMRRSILAILAVRNHAQNEPAEQERMRCSYIE